MHGLSVNPRASYGTSGSTAADTLAGFLPCPPAQRSTSSCVTAQQTLVVASNLERTLQENLMKRKIRGCQDCCRSRTTLANHECEWHIRACAQARDCRSTLQRCRLTVHYDTRDLARDIHGVNCELATAIPGRDRRGDGQTLEVSGHPLPLAFG